ncbi:unnamed protein product [marine sediment metagenome]|uniref:Uncharacterized protein n=1 Tax=marine sediment metagenome TaxID=412755 RepID=X1ACK4_9ZZZZ
MANKIQFDAVNRLIIVNDGVTELDAKGDLYSDAKENWKDDVTLNRLRLPFRTIAGDPLPGGLVVGAYFFLQNQAGWRIRPCETDHELLIKGNLYPEDEGLPMFVSTLGGYTVSISLERSSLTQVSGLPDLSGLVDEVWAKEDRGAAVDKIVNIDEAVGLVSEKVDPIGEATSDMLKVDRGRWLIDKDACQMIFYGEEADGGRSPSPLLVFDLKDEHGNPSVERVFERVPVRP